VGVEAKKKRVIVVAKDADAEAVRLLTDAGYAVERAGEANAETEGRFQALFRTLKAHNNSTRAMMRAVDESEYLEEVCRIVVEDCGHAMVWVGYAENDDYKLVRPVAYSGFEEGYLETLRITWADTERGCGPTGTAVRTGKPSMCRNMLTDPQFEPWREQALKRGYASSIVLPLTADDGVFGAITIYSRDPDPFSEEEVALLSSLADDLSYGIGAIRLSAERAEAEEALRESAQRLSLLSDTASQLLATGDPQGAVQALCENVMAHLDCHVFFNYLCDDERQCLRLNAYAGIPESTGREIEWLDYGAAVCGCAARDACRIVAEDISNTPDPRTELVRSFGIQAYACHPLAGHHGDVIGTLSFGTRSRIRFSDDDLALIQTVADQVATAMERIRLHQEAERRAAELVSFITSMSDGVLLLDSDGSVVLSNEVAIDILGANPGTTLRDRVRHSRASRLDGSPMPIEKTSSYMALQGTPVTDELCVISSPERGDRVVSFSSSPVRGPGGRVLGAATVLRDVTDQVEFERQKDELYAREHHIAEMLQQALIPPDVPKEFGGLAIGVRYQAALNEAEVGGDFYDVFELGGGNVGVLIGDVAGKGLRAAMRVAAARYSVRSYAFIDPRPSHVMILANEALCKDSQDEVNMLTAFFAVVDTATGRMTYATAGHEPALVCSASGAIRELETGEMPLGIFESTVYIEHCVDLAPGDSVVIVTDGITEARAPGTILFKKKGIIEYLSNNMASSPDETAGGLLAMATAHAGGQLQDDAAVVVLRLGCEQPKGSTHG